MLSQKIPQGSYLVYFQRFINLLKHHQNHAIFLRKTPIQSDGEGKHSFRMLCSLCNYTKNGVEYEDSNGHSG